MLIQLNHICGTLSFGQRDTTGLTAENSELKLRLQTIEQQVHLQDGKFFLQSFLCSTVSLFHILAHVLPSPLKVTLYVTT